MSVYWSGSDRIELGEDRLNLERGEVIALHFEALGYIQKRLGRRSISDTETLLNAQAEILSILREDFMVGEDCEGDE